MNFSFRKFEVWPLPELHYLFLILKEGTVFLRKRCGVIFPVKPTDYRWSRTFKSFRLSWEEEDTSFFRKRISTSFLNRAGNLKVKHLQTNALVKYSSAILMSFWLYFLLQKAREKFWYWRLISFSHKTLKRFPNRLALSQSGKVNEK